MPLPSFNPFQRRKTADVAANDEQERDDQAHPGLPTVRLTILDSVLNDIEDLIASYPPERGGALLGPRGRPCISAFLLDDLAAASGASFVPSKELGALVRVHEAEGELEFKGIVHSHPGGFDQLSGADRSAVANGLRSNPHLTTYVAPIVTTAPYGELLPHELQLASGKITFYEAYATRDTGLCIGPICVAALPLAGDLGDLARRLRWKAEPEVFVTYLEGRQIFAGRLGTAKEQELLVFIDEGYPLIPPIVLLALSSSKPPEQLDMAWSLDTEPSERLAAALGRHLDVEKREDAGGR